MDCKVPVLSRRPSSGGDREQQKGIETAATPMRKRAASDEKPALRCGDHIAAGGDAVGATEGGNFPPGTVPVEVLDTVFEVSGRREGQKVFSFSRFLDFFSTTTAVFVHLSCCPLEVSVKFFGGRCRGSIVGYTWCVCLSSCQ